MKRYRISFYNELPNDSGHVSHCCQRMIEIRSAKSVDRAVEAAKHHFTRQEAIAVWDMHAHSFEVEEVRP